VTEDAPQLEGDIFVDRAGVGLFFLYAQLRQLFKDFVRLDFELPSQLINANLIHRYKAICGDAPHSLCEPLFSDPS
jgi:hypothetical protein